MQNEDRNRREFLKDSAAALPIISLQGVAHGSDTDESSTPFQPESFWRERMQEPEDGKKYGWFVDTRRCFGCHGCEVSCKAENDVPLGSLHPANDLQGCGRVSDKSLAMFLPVVLPTLRGRTLYQSLPMRGLE